MSVDPNNPDGVNVDAIDDIISGPAQNLGQQRELGFRMIKERMLSTYALKLQAGKSPLMVRTTQLYAYKEALEDAFRVFTQIVEGSGMSAEGMLE